MAHRLVEPDFDVVLHHPLAGGRIPQRRKLFGGARIGDLVLERTVLGLPSFLVQLRPSAANHCQDTVGPPAMGISYVR